MKFPIISKSFRGKNKYDLSHAVKELRTQMGEKINTEQCQMVFAIVSLQDGPQQ